KIVVENEADIKPSIAALKRILEGADQTFDADARSRIQAVIKRADSLTESLDKDVMAALKPLAADLGSDTKRTPVTNLGQALLRLNAMAAQLGLLTRTLSDSNGQLNTTGSLQKLLTDGSLYSETTATMRGANEIVKALVDPGTDGVLGAIARPMEGHENLLYIYGGALMPMAAMLRRPVAQFVGAGVAPEKIRIVLATREQAGEIRVLNCGQDDADQTELFSRWLTTAYALADGEEFFLEKRSGGNNLMIRSLVVRNRDPKLFAELFDIAGSGWALRGACQAVAEWGVDDEGEPRVAQRFEPIALWAPAGGLGSVLGPSYLGSETVALQFVVVPIETPVPLALAAGASLDEVVIALIAEPILTAVPVDFGGPEMNNSLSDSPTRMLNDSMTRHSATARQVAIATYASYVARFDEDAVPDVPDTLQAAWELGVVAADELIRETIKDHMEDSKGINLGQAQRYAEWLVGSMAADPEMGRGLVRTLVAARNGSPFDDVSIGDY
ncbi:MAG: hypothetical protein WCI73_17120, partial [Phycisphaerae bacterium]